MIKLANSILKCQEISKINPSHSSNNINNTIKINIMDIILMEIGPFHILIGIILMAIGINLMEIKIISNLLKEIGINLHKSIIASKSSHLKKIGINLLNNLDMLNNKDILNHNNGDSMMKLKI